MNIHRKIGDIFTDGNIDDRTGKPYYYRVTYVSPDGKYISSIGCDEKGNTLTINVTTDAISFSK